VEVPTNALAQNVLQVRVPEDAREGQMIQVTSPSGSSVQCKVPPGVNPGSTMFVEIPPSIPQSRLSSTLVPRQVTVKIPPNAKPGDEMQAVLPDGTKFTFRVPVNATPDTAIRVVLNSDFLETQDTSRPPASRSTQQSVETDTKNQRQDRTWSDFPKPVATKSIHMPPRPSEPAQDLSSSVPSTPIRRII
jgi:hypothetical protein